MAANVIDLVAANRPLLLLSTKHQRLLIAMKYNSPKVQQGFSLLEILVAFTIMAVSLTIVLKIFSAGVNTAIVSEDYMVATQIAESLMAKTGIEEPLIASETSGTEDDKYQWTVKIENSSQFVEDESNTELMDVQVLVQWGNEQGNGRMIELNTIKTRHKE